MRGRGGDKTRRGRRMRTESESQAKGEGGGIEGGREGGIGDRGREDE